MLKHMQENRTADRIGFANLNTVFSTKATVGISEYEQQILNEDSIVMGIRILIPFTLTRKKASWCSKKCSMPKTRSPVKKGSLVTAPPITTTCRIIRIMIKNYFPEV